MKSPLLFLTIVSGVVLVGCNHTPPLAPVAPDVSQVACDEIDAARAAAQEAYKKTMQENSDRYVEATRDFQNELNECLDGLWNGGPCDEQWNTLQEAYETAQGDISNDEAYNNYKSAKAERDSCYGNYDANMADYAKAQERKEAECRDMFQIKRDAAERLYYETRNAAKAQLDATLAALDALEEECNKPKVATGGGGGDDEIGVLPGGGTVYEPVPPTPGADACQQEGTVVKATTPSIPGADGTPRTGKAKDLGHRDVAVNSLVSIAEEVTKTPIPLSAINDQIFAGIVCVKLRSRLIELHGEASDAEWSNNRGQQIRLRKKIADYERASQVRCAIAEGRPPADLQVQVGQLQDATFGACQSDADCGDPVCCSETQVGRLTCNVESGQCISSQEDCEDGFVCAGDPAGCIEPIEVVVYNGKYLPVAQMHTYADDSECDAAEHRHANAGSVKALDGTMVPDASTCGYGKVSELPVIKVIPSQ